MGGGELAPPPPVRRVMETPLSGAGYTVIFLVTSRAVHAQCRIYALHHFNQIVVNVSYYTTFGVTFSKFSRPEGIQKNKKLPVSSVCAMHRSALVIAMASITSQPYLTPCVRRFGRLLGRKERGTKNVHVLCMCSTHPRLAIYSAL